ncbi:hypothetical protein L2E82_12448 [Cichorium intybus]|uniref:Uncharacterized protein n=1 Tax=Cichorium intybus TaxID=13427 RepID=A0ACB9GH77_CICIN|nr:hypothetical protein L2E82_12448 [Cichorium intybus]
MLDLNLSFVHEYERADFRGEVEESGTSTSSVVNAEGCNYSSVVEGEGEGDDDSVSAVGDGDIFHCFSFDILKVGDTGALLGNSNDNDEDRTSQTPAEFVTRSLFPMNHGGGSFNQGQQVNSLLLIPNNNELQEMRSTPVQQQKPTVQQNQVGKKSRRGPRSRSSQYRGVTFYRRTGRWESHIWDCGKQVYLGGFDTAHSAARAYDRAAIKFRGVDADINFNLSDYEDDMNQIANLSKEEFVHLLRRHSNGFPRGSSKLRGVQTINKYGRGEAPMGQFLGKKEAIINLEASRYERETVSSSHFGNNHNLDLNLGISTPSTLGMGSSRNGKHMQSDHGMHDIRRLQINNHATTTFKGLPLISNHGQPWSDMYAARLPNHEVGTTNGRMIGGCSQGPTNWAWQIPTTLLTAASSGFPAPAPTNSFDYYYQIRPPPSPPPAPPPTP